MEYLGSFVYLRNAQGVLSNESTDFSAGRIENSTVGYKVNYHITDHLSNVRAIATSTGGGTAPTITSRMDYHTFGTPHVSSPLPTADQKHRYTFCGKEEQRIASTVHAQFKVAVMDQGARYYIPSTTQFTSHDPLAIKYPHISPYNYCAANPIRYVDPDGRKIIGLTRSDASKAKQDFNIIFKASAFDGFRVLITLKGNKFNTISSSALTNAFKDENLNGDQQTLVNEVVGVINSESAHTVEYVDVDGFVSTEGTAVFKSHMNSIQSGVGDAMIPSEQMLGSTMNAVSGGGLNIPTKTGSHSIIAEGDGVTHEKGRAVTTGHEIIGPGVASANKASAANNNIRAVRTENLIRRVMGLPAYPKPDHGGV